MSNNNFGLNNFEDFDEFEKKELNEDNKSAIETFLLDTPVKKEPNFEFRKKIEQKKEVEDEENKEEINQTEPLIENKDFGIFWDSRYDGDFINFYDYKNSPIYKEPAVVYVGPSSTVGLLNTNNIKIYKDLETRNFAIVNPDDEWKKELKRERIYNHFLLDVISDKLKIKINTEWDPIFIENIDECQNYERNAKTIFICPTRDVSNFDEFHSKFLLVPLLETIIHLHQEFYNFSLIQIAIKLNDGYDPEKFGTKIKIMDYVFNFFRDEIKKICSIEKTSIHRIFISDFNIFFKHSKTGLTKKQEVSIAIHMSSVVLRPISLEYSDYSYGNIPYLIRPGQKNQSTHGKNEHILCENGPISFSKVTGNNRNKPCAEYFTKITVFPKKVFEGKMYPSFIMGICESGKSILSRNIVLRGKIFDDITVRENLIINEMYISFSAGVLTRSTDFTKCFSNLILTKEQLAIRSNFIHFIHGLLLDVSGDKNFTP